MIQAFLSDMNRGKRIFWIALLSIFLSISVSRHVLPKYIPKITVTIDVLEETNPQAAPNREVWIESLKIDGDENMQNAFLSAEEVSGFELRKAADYGYNNDVIVNVGGANSRLRFTCFSDCPVEMTFWKQSLSGKIHLSFEEDNTIIDETVIDLYSDIPEERMTYSRPGEAARGRRIRALVYCLVPVAIFCAFMLIILLVKILLKIRCFLARQKENAGNNKFVHGFFPFNGNTSLMFLVAALSIIASFPIFQRIMPDAATNITVTIDVLEETNPQAVPNREVWIESLKINGDENMEDAFLSAEEVSGFELRKAADYGYNNDVIINVGGAGSRLRFTCASDSPVEMTFWKQSLSGKIRLSFEEGDTVIDETVIDLYSDIPEERMTYSRPGEASAGVGTIIIVHCLVSVVAFFVCMLVILLIKTLMGKGLSKVHRRENAAGKTSRPWMLFLKEKAAFLFLVAVFLAFVSFPISRQVMPNTATDLTVTIDVLEETNPQAVPNREVWIESLEINGDENMEDAFLSAEEVSGFELRKAADYGYNNDVIVNVGGANSRLRFTCASDRPIEMTFWKQSLSGKIRLSFEEGDTVIDETVIDLYSDIPEERMTYSRPAEASTAVGIELLVYCLVYIVAFFGCVLIVLLAKKLLKNRRRTGGSIPGAFVSATIAFVLCACLAPVVGKVISFYIPATSGKLFLTRYLSQIALFIFQFFQMETMQGQQALVCLAVCTILFLCLKWIIRKPIEGLLKNDPPIIESRQETGKRFAGIDLLKCLGALFVVFIHGYFDIGFYEHSPHTPDMAVLTAVYTALLCCIPFFALSTGFLMCRKRYSLRFFAGWLKYLIPYFLIMLCQHIVWHFQYGIDLTIEALLDSMSIFDNGYMSMFFGLYLLIPALNMVYDACKTPGNKLCLIAGLLFLTMGQSVLGKMFTRYWVCLAPICYYLSGAFLREYKVRISRRAALILIALCCVLETMYILATSGNTINNGFFWNTYTNYENTYYVLPTYIITLLISILVVDIKELPKMLKTVVLYTSNHTLEVYLISSLFVDALVWTQVKTRIFGGNANPVQLELVMPYVAIVIFIMANALSWPIHKISTWLFQEISALGKGRELPNPGEH